MSSKRLQLKEYGAWIMIDGQEVEHYQVEVDENRNLVTCWIASTEGKSFSVHSLKTGSHLSVAVTIFLDGQTSGGMLLRAGAPRQSMRDGIPTSPQTIRPFVFGALKVSDDDSLLDNPGPIQAIGEIRVQFRRVTVLQQLSHATFSALPKPQDVHERAKKATPHRVQYGEEVQKIQSSRNASCKYHETVAEFKIHYTSLDMLKATGIAPSESSSQEKSASPEAVSDSSAPKTAKRKAVKAENESGEELDEEEEENRKQEEELQAKLACLRKARQDKHKNKKVKRELKPLGIPGEVIDLTI